MTEGNSWLPAAGSVYAGRFRLEALIGTGEHGAVYRARPVSAGYGAEEALAIKLLRPEVMRGASEEQIGRLRRLLAYRHVRIVPVREVVEEETLVGIVQPWVADLNLRAHIALKVEQGATFRSAEAVRLLTDLADALRWIHRFGAHGNLKPENVFVAADGYKVNDAYRLLRSPPVDTGARRGVSPYLPPRVGAELSGDGTRVDSWAVAVLVAEALAGFAIDPSRRLVEQCKAGWARSLDEAFALATSADPRARPAVGRLVRTWCDVLAAEAEREASANREDAITLISGMPAIDADVLADVERGASIEEAMELARRRAARRAPDEGPTVSLVDGPPPLLPSGRPRWLTGAEMPEQIVDIMADAISESLAIIPDLFLAEEEEITAEMAAFSDEQALALERKAAREQAEVEAAPPPTEIPDDVPPAPVVRSAPDEKEVTFHLEGEPAESPMRDLVAPVVPPAQAADADETALGDAAEPTSPEAVVHASYAEEEEDDTLWADASQSDPSLRSEVVAARVAAGISAPEDEQATMEISAADLVAEGNGYLDMMSDVASDDALAPREQEVEHYAFIPRESDRFKRQTPVDGTEGERIVVPRADVPAISAEVEEEVYDAEILVLEESDEVQDGEILDAELLVEIDDEGADVGDDDDDQETAAFDAAAFLEQEYPGATGATDTADDSRAARLAASSQTQAPVSDGVELSGDEFVVEQLTPEMVAAIASRITVEAVGEAADFARHAPVSRQPAEELVEVLPELAHHGVDQSIGESQILTDVEGVPAYMATRSERRASATNESDRPYVPWWLLGVAAVGLLGFLLVRLFGGPIGGNANAKGGMGGGETTPPTPATNGAVPGATGGNGPQAVPPNGPAGGGAGDGVRLLVTPEPAAPPAPVPAPPPEPECAEGFVRIPRAGGAFCVQTHEYPGEGSRPAVNVTFAQAGELCAKLGARLCTSDEFTAACGDKRYPYGDGYRSRKCNTVTEFFEKRPVRRTGTMSGCRSPFGVYDVSGNVAEWVEGTEVAGGGGGSSRREVRCTSRVARDADSRSSYVGFRCCADLTGPQ